jgi:hypothetical protein
MVRFYLERFLLLWNVVLARLALYVSRPVSRPFLSTDRIFDRSDWLIMYSRSVMYFSLSIYLFVVLALCF